MNTHSERFCEKFCPICGAAFMAPDPLAPQTCHFCGFRHVFKQDHSRTQCAKIAIDEINMTVEKLTRILPESTLYREGFDGPFPAYHPDLRDIDIVWSEGLLPFERDLNGYFKDRARSLRPGGLLYISTPIRNLWGAEDTLPGQVNFFRSKNIMFLLERHGFKLDWRSRRFSKNLRLIARLL